MTIIIIENENYKLNNEQWKNYIRTIDYALTSTDILVFFSSESKNKFCWIINTLKNKIANELKIELKKIKLHNSMNSIIWLEGIKEKI